MKPDNLMAGAAGAGALAATVGLSTKAFEQNVATMNRQIETDLSTLGQTGQLPDVQPVLPLGSQKRPILGLIISSLAIGAAITGGLTFVVLLIAGLGQTSSGFATDLMAATFYGFGAAILAGWVPGSIIYYVRQIRENSRRYSWAVFEKYGAYWNERAMAQAALRAHAVDPVVVAQRLSAHHLDNFLED